jgi:phosphoadenosine phosphosulfate reductase
MQLTLNQKTIDTEAIEFIQDTVQDKIAFVAVSGGKDSDVMAHLVMRSGVKYESHYHRTGLDAPETIHHLKQDYPECIFDIPKRTFWQGMMSNGLPRRKQRWCCAELKECFGRGRILIQGIRSHESQSRKERNAIEHSRINDGTLFVSPIFGWTTREVWQYIDEYHIPHNPLYYTNGKRVPRRRIGCILCPNATQRECRRQMELFPGFVKLYKDYANRYVQIRKERGTPLTQKSGEEYFNWWISEH